MQRKVLLIVLITFIVTPNFIFANCDSQDLVEENIHLSTVEYMDQIVESDNAIRTVRLIDEWYADLMDVICLGQELTFTGLVWSVAFDDETKNYILRIGNLNESVTYPFFYNYQFS